MIIKKNARKFLAILFAVMMIAVMIVQAWASEVVDAPTVNEPTGVVWDNDRKDAIEVLTDIVSRGDVIPTEYYDLTIKSYSAGFSIYNFTHSGKYFKPSSSGVLYYSLVNCEGGGSNCVVTVKSYCKTCGNKEMSSYSFTKTQSSQTENRKLTFSDTHKTHNIYFKISKTNNDYQLGGTLKVSHSLINA